MPEETSSFLLTVVIPAYNEESTIQALLDRVFRAPYEKQIVVVDDCSADSTARLAEEWCQQAKGIEGQYVTLRLPENQGKGSAIRHALTKASGLYVIIQDADLEYFPDDFPKLLEPLQSGAADIVFGSRYLLAENIVPWTPNRICVVLLNFFVLLLFRKSLSDEASCYKCCKREIYKRMELQCRRFEFCPEVTAKACLLGLRILEVPIRYEARTKQFGKKIRWWDGVHAFGILMYWRVFGFREASTQSEERT